MLTPIKNRKMLAALALGILVLGAGPQLAMARGWGDVFDPTRFGKNTAIYAEKVKELESSSKVYANMLLALAKLAGINEANNSVLSALQEYRDNKTPVINMDYLNKDYSVIWDGTIPTCDGPSLVVDTQKKRNAQNLEGIEKHMETQNKFQKTVAVLLKMKADGTLGELQKGNYLDGLSVSQKLEKINTDIQKYEQYAQELDTQRMEELIETDQISRQTSSPAYDPYHPEKFKRTAEQEKMDHYDAFGNKNYQTKNLGFKQF